MHMAKSCFGLYYEHKSKGRTVKKMVKMLQGGRTAAPARTRAEKRARGRQRRRRAGILPSRPPAVGPQTMRPNRAGAYRVIKSFG